MEKVLPGINESELIPIWKMREELKEKYSFDHVDKLSPDDVESVWLEHALHESLNNKCDTKFPVLPTSALHSGEHWKDLATLDLNFGGAFIRNPDIDSKFIPGILELICPTRST